MMAFVVYVTGRFLRGAVSSDFGLMDPMCPSLKPKAMPLSDMSTLFSSTCCPETSPSRVPLYRIHNDLQAMDCQSAPTSWVKF